MLEEAILPELETQIDPNTGAQILSLKPRVFARLLRSGRIPGGYRLNPKGRGGWRISTADLQSFINARRAESRDREESSGR